MSTSYVCEATNITGVPYNNWTLGAGSDKVSAVNLPHDGTTSYVASGILNHRQCWNVDWPTDVAEVNWIKCVSRIKDSLASSNQCSYGVRNASGETTQGTGVLTTSYVTRTSPELAKPGGGSWQVSDLADGVTYMQVMYTARPTGGGPHCTTMYLVVNYEFPGGGFVFLLSQLLPFLGAAITMDMMPGIVSMLKKHILDPEDCVKLYTQIKECKHVAYQF